MANLLARLIAATLLFSASAPAANRSEILFDSDWRFFRGDMAAASQPAFDDSNWSSLSVPHDWSIEGPFDQKNPTGGAGAFLPAGIGWYRKHFHLPADRAHDRVFLDFDGVMANSDVWINGEHLGKRPYGYVSFRYELTGHAKFGDREDNVIAVRADNSGQPASRWYTGAGIYRHVHLVLADAVHVDHWATFVKTPQVSNAQAVVHIASAIVNQSGALRRVTVETEVRGPDGRASSARKEGVIAAGASEDFGEDIAVQKPRLWDLEHPDLYRATVRVREGKVVLDEETVPFGIREFHFDAATGFWLNGRNFKIKGVALHHDGGALGAAVPLDIWERRLEQLRRIGVNAIRTAHNPASPEFLDLCDRKGFLVMEEMFDCWTVAKNPYDYHLYFREWSPIDTRDTVRRDRNHPSVILYSAGNEIHDTPKADLAKQILRGLIDVFHANDPTRPVTQALFRPNVSHDYDNGLADMLDVIGQNYRENEILAAHAAKPERKIIGTENQQGRDVWLTLRDHPEYAGQFLWSGIDYLGESRNWPYVQSGFGLLDRTGARKPVSYERESWWSDTPMVYMARRVAPQQRAVTDPGYEAGSTRNPQTLFSDWTPAARASHEENVEVYSNCQEVELLLNGRSLGAKPLPADASPRKWRVPFAPGTLRAIGRNGATVAATNELRTAGAPAKIVLSADRSSIGDGWDNVTVVTATITDENGTPVPAAVQQITFGINDAGSIVAVDNADPASHEPFQASRRDTYQGRCVAIVRARASRGSIVLDASSPGLNPASIRVAISR